MRNRNLEVGATADFAFSEEFVWVVRHRVAPLNRHPSKNGGSNVGALQPHTDSAVGLETT